MVGFWIYFDIKPIGFLSDQMWNERNRNQDGSKTFDLSIWKDGNGKPL